MESLQIRAGVISLQILDDAGEEKGIFKFNPNDIKVAKGVFHLKEEFTTKSKEFDVRRKKCKTAEQKMEFLEEIVNYLESSIDAIFGSGSSELLFGESKSLDMFTDFFDGIIPYFTKASEDRMAKYK